MRKKIVLGGLEPEPAFPDQIVAPSDELDRIEQAFARAVERVRGLAGSKRNIAMAALRRAVLGDRERAPARAASGQGRVAMLLVDAVERVAKSTVPILDTILRLELEPLREIDAIATDEMMRSPNFDKLVKAADLLRDGDPKAKWIAVVHKVARRCGATQSDELGDFRRQWRRHVRGRTQVSIT